MSQHKTKGQLHSELVHKAVLEVIETEQNWTSDHKFSIKQWLKQQHHRKLCLGLLLFPPFKNMFNSPKKRRKSNPGEDLQPLLLHKSWRFCKKYVYFKSIKNYQKQFFRFKTMRRCMDISPRMSL